MAPSAILPATEISRFHAPDTDRAAFLAALGSAAYEVGSALPEERWPEIENLKFPQVRGYTRTGTECTAGSGRLARAGRHGPGACGARHRRGRSRPPRPDRPRPSALRANGVEGDRAAPSGGGAAVSREPTGGPRTRRSCT